MKLLDKQAEYFPLIDIAKLVCALLVVMIHCLEVVEGHPIADFIVKCFSSQAVPFFMIVSGFFSMKKIEKMSSIEDVAKYCLKSWILLYLVWAILWMPYNIFMYLDKYPNATALYIILMLIRRVFFAGQGVYWYLLVLAEAVFVVGLFVYLKKERFMYCVAIIGLILGILYDANISAYGMSTVHKLFYSLFSWSNNVFMKGVPYVAIGYYFRKNIKSYNFNIWKSSIIYMMASIGMIGIYMSGKIQWLSLYPIQAVMLFSIAYKTSCLKIKKSTSVVCRNMSSSIYFLHTVFIYSIIDHVWGIDALIILKFGVTVLLSVLIYYLVMKFQNPFMKWLLGIKD